MANTRRKGRKNELRAKKMLEAEGFEVEIARPSTRYSTQNDLFGLWDLIAIRRDTIRLIQVKTNRKIYGKALLPYDAFRCPSVCSKEIWTFYDRKEEPFIKYL